MVYLSSATSEGGLVLLFVKLARDLPEAVIYVEVHDLTQYQRSCVFDVLLG